MLTRVHGFQDDLMMPVLLGSYEYIIYVLILQYPFIILIPLSLGQGSSFILSLPHPTDTPDDDSGEEEIEAMVA